MFKAIIKLLLEKFMVHLYKHITPAVEIICQLVTVMLLGQNGLHLHHPRGDKNIVRLHIPAQTRDTHTSVRSKKTSKPEIV